MRTSALVVLCAALLGGAMVRGRETPSPAEADTTRAAASRAIGLLQQSMTTWDTKRQCASCHHQHLPIALLRTAREHGVPFDVAAAQASIARVAAPAANLDFAVQAVMQIDPTMDSGSWLNALSDTGVHHTLSTQVFARRIASRQLTDGRWVTIDVRPPQSFSTVTATAVAVRAVRDHLPPEMHALRDEVSARARRWLETVSPADTEERTFQLLGLSWVGASSMALRPMVDRLLGTQRSDGGWAQLPRRQSDAYATGQALVALQRAGGLPSTHGAIRRGLSYLLAQQKPDGSWLVETRLHEQDLVSPPYFETGFPHGPHQIVSTMGTAWAAMALLESLPLTAPGATVLDTLAVDTSGERPWMQTALFGTADQLRSLLDQGLDANSRSAAGTTLLMMAAGDADKVGLLLARGADVSATSDARHTALMVAANQTGSIEAMRALLDRGAAPNATPVEGSIKDISPMGYAIWSGEPQKLTLLAERGATLPRRVSLLGGQFSATPLELAIFLHDVATVRALATRGADVNEIGEVGVSPLTQAILSNDVGTVQALLALGASVNQIDQGGKSPLMHAASIDYGDTAVLKALLQAGADKTAKSADGLTSAALAKQYGHTAFVPLLE
jgi:ankyrin repeat protein